VCIPSYILLFTCLSLKKYPKDINTFCFIIAQLFSSYDKLGTKGIKNKKIYKFWNQFIFSFKSLI